MSVSPKDTLTFTGTVTDTVPPDFVVTDIQPAGTQGTLPDGTTQIHQLVIGRELTGLSAFT